MFNIIQQERIIGFLDYSSNLPVKNCYAQNLYMAIKETHLILKASIYLYYILKSQQFNKIIIFSACLIIMRKKRRIKKYSAAKCLNAVNYVMQLLLAILFSVVTLNLPLSLSVLKLTGSGQVWQSELLLLQRIHQKEYNIHVFSLSIIYFGLFKYGCPPSLHLLSSEVCKPTLHPNFQYMAHILYFRYLFFALSPLKIFLSSPCVCMSLTDHK